MGSRDLHEESEPSWGVGTFMRGRCRHEESGHSAIGAGSEVRRRARLVGTHPRMADRQPENGVLRRRRSGAAPLHLRLVLLRYVATTPSGGFADHSRRNRQST